MAMLVAVGGAGVSTAFGLGPGPGWLVGSVLGSILFPPSGPKPIEEPRLGDLSVTSSAYGAPIAVPYGTLRLAGNMIWSSGIRERRNIQKAGGKGGGAPAQSAVSYAYSASFAIAFGEGPAEEVLRIWADGKLIVDRTGQSPRFAKRNLRYRFHPGTETQLPDPLIESHVGDGLAPAHRGLCTLVFEDLALADFGNRIPSISAEIAFTRGAVSQPMTLASHSLGTISGPGGVDPRRNRAYRINTGQDFLRVIDLSTLTVTRQLDSADLALGTEPAHTGLGVMTVGVDSGCLYLTYAISCQSARKRDPVFGVICIQSGPRGRRVQIGFHEGHGSRGWDAGCGDDCEDPPRLFRSREADQGDLPRASGVAEGCAQGDPVGGDGVSLRARHAAVAEDRAVARPA